MITLSVCTSTTSLLWYIIYYMHCRLLEEPPDKQCDDAICKVPQTVFSDNLHTDISVICLFPLIFLNNQLAAPAPSNQDVSTGTLTTPSFIWTGLTAHLSTHRFCAGTWTWHLRTNTCQENELQMYCELYRLGFTVAAVAVTFPW